MDNTIFIFLDDVRNPPSKDWVVSRSAGAAYYQVRSAALDGYTIVLSLDHDLGENVPTGYDLVSWLEKDIAIDDTFRPNISFQIHSANPVGRQNMDAGIRSIMRMLG